MDRRSATLGLPGGHLHRQRRHQTPPAQRDPTLPEHQLRVLGSDEEGGQVSAGDGRAQHPGRAEESGEAGRPAGEDPEGSRRVPGEGAGFVPSVSPHCLDRRYVTSRHVFWHAAVSFSNTL